MKFNLILPAAVQRLCGLKVQQYKFNFPLQWGERSGTTLWHWTVTGDGALCIIYTSLPSLPPSLPLWYPDQVNVIPQLTINLTALITRTIHSTPVQSRGEPGQLSANMGRTARQSVTWLKHQQNFISLHASLWPPGGHRDIGVVVLVVVGSLVVSCC